MQGNGYYGSPYGDYWGQGRAHEQFQGYQYDYSAHENKDYLGSSDEYGNWGNDQVNAYGAQQPIEACQTCGGYGHETHACPNIEWRYVNGVWELYPLPNQGSYYTNDSFYAGQEPESTYDPHEANLQPPQYTSEDSMQQGDADTIYLGQFVEDSKSIMGLLHELQDLVTKLVKAKEEDDKKTPSIVPIPDVPIVNEEETIDLEGFESVECEEPIVPEPELKVEYAPLPESSQYFLTSVDEIKVVCTKYIDEVIWDNRSIRSSEKKVDTLHERYREYVPEFYRVYEEHDRGPTSSCNPKFLESHRGLKKILRLTKRHIDAILDKRIIEEDWGATLSNTLPSSFGF